MSLSVTTAANPSACERHRDPAAGPWRPLPPAPSRRTARLQLLAVGASIVAVTTAHVAAGVGTHPQHVVHVVLEGLYLLPITAAAIWFGLAGGLAASGTVSALFGIHVLVSWRGLPMENANQAAMIAVYLLLGSVCGALARQQERERRRRQEAEAGAQREAVLQAVAGLSHALGLRDAYTRSHSERVSRLSVAIASRLGLDAAATDRLRLAGLVHDIGKIGIRDDLLFNRDELTQDERSRIERHPTLAWEVLRAVPGAGEIAEIVLSHHECPDGSGYPRGLRGDAIAPEARILRVADVFSAMTEARPYKAAMASAPALEWMDGVAGTQLDAPSLRALESALADGLADGDPTR